MYKKILRTISILTCFFLIFIPVIFAGWEEGQPFGEFSKADILKGVNSIWIVGQASSFEYPAFQFINNKWMTVDRNAMSKDLIFSNPAVGIIEGGIEIVPVNSERYYVIPNYRNNSIIVSLNGGQDIYSKFKLDIKGLYGFRTMDVSGNKILIAAFINYPFEEGEEEIDRTQMACGYDGGVFSLRLVIFDVSTKTWTIHPSPPITEGITCGFLSGQEIWLGTCEFSEMGTAFGGMHGIAIYNMEKRKYTYLNTDNSPLKSNGIIKMKKYGPDLWIVTVKGIQRYSFTTGKWDSYMIDKKVTVLSDANIYLSGDNQIGTIKKGNTLIAGQAYFRRCSVPLDKQMEGWVVGNEEWVESHIRKENEINYLILPNNAVVYSKPSKDSVKIPVEITYMSGLKYRIISRNQEWIKVQISEGWIDGEQTWPAIVEK